METTKKAVGPRRKSLRLVKEEKTVNNKINKRNRKTQERSAGKAAASELQNIEIVFHADSKEALETCAHPRELVIALQSLTLKFEKEIQVIGKAFGVELAGRTVFNAKLKGS